MDDIDLNFNPNGMMMTIDQETGEVTNVELGGSAYTAGVRKGWVVHAIRRDFTPKLFDQATQAGQSCEVIVQHTNNVPQSFCKEQVRGLFIVDDTPGVVGVYSGSMKHMAFEEEKEVDPMDAEAVQAELEANANELLNLAQGKSPEELEPMPITVDFNQRLWMTHLGKTYLHKGSVDDSVVIVCTMQKEEDDGFSMEIKLRFPKPAKGEALGNVVTGDVFVNDVPGGVFELTYDEDQKPLSPLIDENVDQDFKEFTLALGNGESMKTKADFDDSSELITVSFVTPLDIPTE